MMICFSNCQKELDEDKIYKLSHAPEKDDMIVCPDCSVIDSMQKYQFLFKRTSANSYDFTDNTESSVLLQYHTAEPLQVVAVCYSLPFFVLFQLPYIDNKTIA
jgi:hypothetical protein